MWPLDKIPGGVCLIGHGWKGRIGVDTRKRLLKDARITNLCAPSSVTKPFKLLVSKRRFYLW